MFSSSPPVPKSVEGNMCATAEKRSAVKLCVAVMLDGAVLQEVQRQTSPKEWPPHRLYVPGRL